MTVQEAERIWSAYVAGQKPPPDASKVEEAWKIISNNVKNKVVKGYI